MEQTSLREDSRIVVRLLDDARKPFIYSADEIRREDYAHLHTSRSITSLAYLPLLHNEELIGAMEVVAFTSQLRMSDLEAQEPLLQLAVPAILAAEEFESQRQTLLDSVHRMTQLYDLEKSLNATLDLDEVIAMVPGKVASMLACQAIHLWMFDGDELRLVGSSGQDGTVSVGTTQAPGEGYVADMAETGETLLIADAADERLAHRNATGNESDSPAITNALLVPLLQDEAEIGVLEAVNRDEHPFDEDDEFFLMTVAETVSSALKNASLMLAERKLEILKTLVHVSSEITSTLRLDRLLQIIVNSPQHVLPYERCSVALDHRGRLQLKAVSGLSALPLGDENVERLHGLMRWLSTQPELVHLRRHEGKEAEEEPEIPPVIQKYFDEAGYRGLYALPLNDDQGRVGVLVYESSDPDFLDLPHIEMIKVLAGQATVAIRNAMLYREVPLIGLIEPLVQRKQALLRSSRSRRIAYSAVIAGCALFLAFFPLPMRVSGDAVVAPQHLVTIAAPVDGNVMAVYTHEGQRVSTGYELAAMNDWQWRTDLAAAEAQYQEAVLRMNDDLAHGSALAGADRARVEYLRSEVERARTRLTNAELRSPIAGIVVTPNLQNAAGEHLDAGAPFAQVLDLSSATMRVAVAERDAVLLQAGQSAAIKLDSYPERTWHGQVAVVSPEAHAADGDRTFAVEIPLTNSDATLRAGMSGRGKVFIGWRPAGYVLLRRPALWIWQTLWDWIGW